MAGTGTNCRQGSASQARRAAALAGLLHAECTRLLELYRQREAFPPPLSTPGDPVVTVPRLTPQVLSEQRVWLTHAALRQCLGLLERAISREDAELATTTEGEYETQRRTVRERLRHLLLSTQKLLVASTALTPLPDINEDGTDGSAGQGAFALKMWIYRILQDLVHWSESASQTLQPLQTQAESVPKRAGRKGRKGRRGRGGQQR